MFKYFISLYYYPVLNVYKLSEGMSTFIILLVVCRREDRYSIIRRWKSKLSRNIVCNIHVLIFSIIQNNTQILMI